MLQRIQTLYLLIALVLGLTIFFFPFAHIQVDGNVYQFIPTGIFPETENGFIKETYPVIALLAIHLIVTIITIFLYKTRPLQLKLGMLNTLLLLGLLTAIVLYLDQGTTGAELYHNADQSDIKYGVSTFLPIVSVILIVLANRSIKKDEMLVRSTERLR